MVGIQTGVSVAQCMDSEKHLDSACFEGQPTLVFGEYLP